MSSYKKNFLLFSICLVAFIDWMGIGLVYPMFSSLLFQNDLGFLSNNCSDTARGIWLGVLLSSMPIAQFFSSPIVGTMSDQHGRKPILQRTLLLCLIGYVLSSLSIWMESLSLLLVSRLIIGIGAGNAAVVSAVLADVSKPEEKVKNYGLLNMAYGVGLSVGPFLGGKLSNDCLFSWGGYDKPFIFAALLTFLNYLLIVFMFQETHKAKKESKSSLFEGLKNLKKAFKSLSMRSLFIAVFLFCFGWSFFWEFIPVHWIKDHHLSISEIGSFYAYGAFIYALSCGLLIRPVSSRIRPPVILFSALILLGFFIFLLYIDPGLSSLWIYIPLQQYTVALIFPTAMAMVSNWVNEEAQGEMMGILQSVVSAAFAVCPLLSGLVISISTWMPILGGGVLLLLAGAIFGRGSFHMIFKQSPFLPRK